MVLSSLFKQFGMCSKYVNLDESYLNILNKGSDVEERHLDRRPHLLVGCLHEGFEGGESFLVVLLQFIHLISSGVLRTGQRWKNKRQINLIRSHAFKTSHFHCEYLLWEDTYLLP